LDKRVASLVLPRRGGLGGLSSQRVMAHDHALAVAGDHQDVAVRARIGGALGVERLEVAGGTSGEILGLALAQPLSRGTLDRGDRLVKRAARGLQRGQAPQPVRVTLDGQVQHRVGPMQVRCAALSIGQPRDLKLAEHAPRPRERPASTVRRVTPSPPTTATAAPLTVGAHVQMILEQLAQKLAAVALQALLEVKVRQGGGLHAVQQADQPVKQRASNQTRPRRPPASRPARSSP
jgi:hypothetical protein